jgi:hypothetical protein
MKLPFKQPFGFRIGFLIPASVQKNAEILQQHIMAFPTYKTGDTHYHTHHASDGS